jgi:hypothetical protein
MKRSYWIDFFYKDGSESRKHFESDEAMASAYFDCTLKPNNFARVECWSAWCGTTYEKTKVAEIGRCRS